MKWVLGAVVVTLAVCACGLNQYQDPYGNQGPYGYGQGQQQQPGNQQKESVQEHATFKIESTETVFGPKDSHKITECRYEKTNSKIFMGVQFVSSDATKSMKIALSDLSETSVSAQWSGANNAGKEITLTADTRSTSARYTNQSRTYTADCTIYYQLEGKLLLVRYFSCKGLQNGSTDRSNKPLEFSATGEFACYLKTSDATQVR